MTSSRELIERLDDAILLAVQAHRGQTDKAGEPYILHPLRVMHSLDDMEHKIVGVLHDVVEDSDYSLTVIAIGFGKRVADAVEALSRRDDESYPDFIKRAGANPIARRVKIADLKDNLRPGCPPSLQKRYRAALQVLEG